MRPFIHNGQIDINTTNPMPKYLGERIFSYTNSLFLYIYIYICHYRYFKGIKKIYTNPSVVTTLASFWFMFFGAVGGKASNKDSFDEDRIRSKGEHYLVKRGNECIEAFLIRPTLKPWSSTQPWFWYFLVNVAPALGIKTLNYFFPSYGVK